MSAGTSELFCLICLLLCSCTFQEIIEAEVGQNMVILQCKVPNNNITSVVWKRPDLHPEYVLVYRNGRMDPNIQHPSYQNRVDLQDKDMKDGDASLILKNVKMEDNGRYECRVFEKGKKYPISITTLKVLPPALEIIEAELGQDVILQCKVPNKYNINNIAVEWRRLDLDPEYILVYRDGRLDPDIQHPSYQNRVDLQDKDIKDGDFSLILMNVTMEDRGTYECRVFEEGNNEVISNITLEVHENEEEKSKDRGNNTGIIVGSVVSVILLLAVLGHFSFLICRRHMRRNLNLPIPPDEAAEQIL